MGVVIKQSFWGVVISYAGLILGYFNTLYLRAEFLDLTEIGIMNLVSANAMLISPFCNFGQPATWIKYFPSVSNNQKLKTQLFSLMFYLILGISAIIFMIAILFRENLLDYFNHSQYSKYLVITALVILGNSLFDLFFAYSRAMLTMVMPNFLREIYIKFFSIVLVGGVALNWWSFDFAVKGLAVNYFSAVAILIIYLAVFHSLRLTFKFDLIDKEWLNKIIRFGSFSMTLAIGTSVLANVSFNQVTSILGDAANGIYGIVFFIGLIVEIPRKNMMLMIAPILSNALELNDQKEIKNIFVKSSLTLAVISTLFMVGIITNLDDLFILIPKGEEIATGFWVVVYICFGKLIATFFGPSIELLSYSKNRVTLLYIMIIGAAILIYLNSLLLPIYGITGTGIATFISITIQTLLRHFIIYRYFGISPFNKSHLNLIIIGAMVLALIVFIPLNFHPVLSIMMRSTIICLIYLPVIYYSRISIDINLLIEAAFKKLRF